MGPLLFFFIFTAVFIAFAIQDRDRINKTWQGAATELGLRCSAGSFFSRPRISGAIGDVQVEVSVYSSGGENSSTYTRYLVRHLPVGPPVTLRKQGALSFMRRLIGGKDVLVGDPFFDSRVVVDSTSDAAVRDFLTPERQAAVLDLLSVHSNGEFTHDSIRIDVRKICRKRSELVANVRRLVDIASVMGDTLVSEILEHQQHGDLVRAAQELHELNQQRANVFTETLEGEAYAEAGYHVEAAAVLDDVWEQQGGDPVVDGWHDLSHLPPPPPVPAAPAPEPALAPQAAAVAPASSVRQDVVVDDLFSSDRMSWEVVEYFEQTYRNATVEWSGAVTRLSKYQRDLDFGVGPGIKATVMIGHAGVSDVISNEVHAVVQLPADAVVQSGDQIRFRGVLTSVDRFSRKVWVQHAAVV